MTKLTVPEWLPDWRDEKAYTYLNDASPTQWAWEFVRRNPKYQADYDAYTKAVNEPRALPGESWSDYIKRAKEKGGWQIPPATAADKLSKKYKVEPRPYDPAVKDPPIQFTEATPEQPPWVDFGYDHPGLRHAKEPFHLVFDLSQPIKPQLRNAEKMMEVVQPAMESTEDRQHSKLHTRLFLIYIRLLDADEAGAKLGEITPILLPGVSNIDPDYLGNKRLRANLKKARELRDHDYIYIALRSEVKK